MDKEIRTLGDGMDSTIISGPPAIGLSTLNQCNIKIANNISSSILNSLRPVEPNSKIFWLVPKYIPKERKVPKCLIKKSKEPKFIPYEPYKAAVEPIICKRTMHKQVVEIKPSKNNIEIHALVSQLSELRETEMNKTNVIDSKTDETFKLRLQWEKEKEAYETDIKNLRETNSHLENQLKFQAQHLTEDKLSLARALLKSANHLTSHQEQTEWLSGQCEVWRSKFLASSLMVEELAKWKSALTNRINDLQEVLKSLLEERRKVHSQSLKTCSYLKLVADKLTDNEKEVKLKHGSIIELANVNEELSQCALKGLKLQDEITKYSIPIKLTQHTVAEKAALKLLQNPVMITTKQDALCNAVMGAATSQGGKQMFLQHPSMHACCSHCKGDVQNI
ncbi:hypothetical protein NQ314_011833 [Rhamnusium bicolor]|uniref:Golgin-45 n=1 Tax=Rhamnusium bicolor TaxID=1586634 RepID=A0AAV8XHB6_9CUCU|nr:hypothetical protein NQ314_011833 [Rhamnusium bicolor]